MRDAAVARRGVLVVLAVALLAAGFWLRTQGPDVVCLRAVTFDTGPQGPPPGRYGPPPDVVGLTLHEAGLRLQRAGFDVLDRVPCNRGGRRPRSGGPELDPIVVARSRPFPSPDLGSTTFEGRLAIFLTTDEYAALGGDG